MKAPPGTSVGPCASLPPAGDAGDRRVDAVGAEVGQPGRDRRVAEAHHAADVGAVVREYLVGAHLAHLHGLALLPAEEVGIEAVAGRGVAGHQLVPVAVPGLLLVEGMATFAAVRHRRGLQDAEARALRVGEDREAAGVGDVGRLLVDAAAGGLDVRGRLVGVIDREIDHPEGRHPHRLGLGRHLHQPGDHVAARGREMVLEAVHAGVLKAPAEDLAVEVLGGAEISLAGAQLVPAGLSVKLRHHCHSPSRSFPDGSLAPACDARARRPCLSPASAPRPGRTAARAAPAPAGGGPRISRSRTGRPLALGERRRHVALRHRLRDRMAVAARGHPADHAPVAVDAARRPRAPRDAGGVEARRAVAMRLFDRAVILAVDLAPRSARRPSRRHRRHRPRSETRRSLRPGLVLLARRRRGR